MKFSKSERTWNCTTIKIKINLGCVSIYTIIDISTSENITKLWNPNAKSVE